MAKQMTPLPDAKSVRVNPSADELKELAAKMPNARETRYGNLNVQTEVLARSKASTFLVLDDPDASSQQAISREEGERIAKLQDDYIAEQDMIVVDGYIGNDPEFRTAARLYIEEANANIAGMQKQLYFDVDDPDSFEPELTVIYTPNLSVEGYPNDRVISVDLEQGVTRVCNPDYFGESKKGGLRMWNKLVYDRGGLPLHAGCKVIPTDGGDKVGLIVGLSGTGKTTTTFTKQNGSLPVQDDFVAMMPGGKVYATEAGCFAKTFALSEEDEPTIFGAVTKPEAYLENVSQDDEGSEKVRIKHSSAIVKGIAEGSIEWVDDPDFGYQVAKAVPGIEESDAAVLRPKDLYESQGRQDDYRKIVDTLKSERVEFLQKFPALSDEIVDAVR